MTTRRVLIHKTGCGKPAVRQRDPFRAFATAEVVRSADWEHLDGRPLGYGERSLCDSCGQSLQPEDWRRANIVDDDD